MLVYQRLKEFDVILLKTLEKSSPQTSEHGSFRNKKVEQLAKNLGKSIEPLWKLLKSKHAFDLNYEVKKWKDIDGERREVIILRAADTRMWPMGTHYWVRDNAIIGARLLGWKGGREARRFSELGREVLLSSLTIISSGSQLLRFERMIKSSSARYKSKHQNWPQIFLEINSNLTGTKSEPWSHKQDAWQMLAWFVLSALREGRLSLRDLTVKHRRFLGLLVPFLFKADHLKQENSGSWEELEALRSSVIAWETRLIDLVGELSQVPGFAFLNEGFNWSKRYLPAKVRKSSLAHLCRMMTKSACHLLAAMLPFESPKYSTKGIRYRQADGALIYLLQLGIPEFVADRLGFDVAWASKVEGQILETLETLIDKRTGGIFRYLNDSYQRSGFFRHETVAKLIKLYGAPSGDASSHFVGRDNVVPQGRKAAWSHFVWQLCAWAGRKFLITSDLRYRKLQRRFFKQALRTVTGEGEVSLKVLKNGRVKVFQIPAFRFTEAYVSDKTSGDKNLIFPSPHTPLNWAVAEALDAFGVMKEVAVVSSRDIGNAAR